MKQSAKHAYSRYSLLFLLFCIIGWLYEVGLAFLYGYGFVNRGFLFGPYLPLYGFGALLLIVCLRRLMERRIRVGRVSVTPAVVFLGIVAITTALEYAVGWLLETLFHQRFWDYSTYAWQLHGRICLSASVRFGIGGMVFLYVLTPLFDRLLDKVPPKLRFALGAGVTVLLLADCILTLYIAAHHGFNPVLAQPK